jgi:hypothetical protein
MANEHRALRAGIDARAEEQSFLRYAHVLHDALAEVSR